MTAYGGDGFEEFVEAEIPRLLTFAVLIGARKDDAWDLVQDTLVRLGTRWSSLDHDRDLHAYARKIVMNLHVSRWRRLRRELPLLRAMNKRTDVIGFDLVEMQQVLQPALRSLSPGQRAVVVLRYFEDCTEAETAELLGCSIGTVKSQHARAIERLRRYLAPMRGDALTPRPAEEER
jgi:RNA polymerase sigma-70 factor (sigma-E family)